MSKPTFQIWKTFEFEAAHRLPRVISGHKCSKMHGHSYRVTLWCRGVLDEEMEWVLDYAEIRAAWMTVDEELDHKCLNDVRGLENPTAENLCLWLLRRLRPRLAALSKIQVQETADSGAEVMA